MDLKLCETLTNAFGPSGFESEVAEAVQAALPCASQRDAMQNVYAPFAPVSYTHLDVYKRQTRMGAGNARFLCADAAEAAQQLLAEGLRPDVVVLDPVSYTHLDVYKRQGRCCPHPGYGSA